MLPGMEMLTCPNLAVSPEVMQHIVQVESGANPYAIGVVDGRLVRQPGNMDEALATARMLESKGYNFSLGIAQVNRANLRRYGLDSYRKAFDTCENLAAGARILAGCYDSAQGDWGKAFSCYYSGDFTTGFRDGYVQKIYASINRATEKRNAASAPASQVIPLMVPAAMATTAWTNIQDRPVTGHAGDRARYLVTLRSVAMDNAAAAITQLAASAGDHSPRPGTLLLSNAIAQQIPGGTTAQAAAQGTHISGNPHSQAPDVTRSAVAGSPNPADDRAFRPRVHGPNDPPPSSTVVPVSTQPPADGGDLRLEKRDAAFVF